MLNHRKAARRDRRLQLVVVARFELHAAPAALTREVHAVGTRLGSQGFKQPLEQQVLLGGPIKRKNDIYSIYAVTDLHVFEEGLGGGVVRDLYEGLPPGLRLSSRSLRHEYNRRGDIEQLDGK